MSALRSLATVYIPPTFVALAIVTLVGAFTAFRADALPLVIDLNSTSADLTVFGDDVRDQFGRSVAAGDINGDTIDDLIIGARLADPAGETYVIYGGASLPTTIDLNSTSADLTVFGDDLGDLSGQSVAAGDINGDTTEDLIIGAYRANPAGGSDAGETYVIYGGPTLPATIDLNSTSADLTVFGDDAFDDSGQSVAAGDIDGDGTDDLIIGAVAANAAGGTNAGETYVIYGGPGLPATIDLNSTSADLTVFGDDALDGSGVSVAAADIDGDTIDDLIIGALFADPVGGTDAGETYVIYGGASLPATIDLNSTSADLTIFGDDPFDLSGASVAAADIDGDTIDDLIIGANQADPAGGGSAGETYVIYGGPGLPATIDLNSTSADLTVFGDDAGDASGSFVAAGDIDGDGTDDLILSAVGADPAGGSIAGETYVIYGSSSLSGTIDLNSASAGLTVFGDDAEDGSGHSLAAGDFNGDGTDDLLIGAPAGDGPGAGPACHLGGSGDRCHAGEVYVIFGEPPPTATPTPAAPPVGGIAVDPDVGVLPLETPTSSGSSVSALAGLIAGATIAVAIMGGAAWYAARRWLRQD